MFKKFIPRNKTYGIFAALLNFNAVCSILLPVRTRPDSYENVRIEPNEKFDFIVIGSGPTGSVIANRLTEISDWKVLLLEAGKEGSNIVTEIPAFSAGLQFTDFNWGYKAEIQDGFCTGCTERRLLWPHGKALGGSTVINYMIHVRGNKGDYNRWAAMGNPGWSYDDVLPYFIKSEDAEIEKQDPEYHNSGGYLVVSDLKYRTKVVEAYVKAAQEVGLPYVDYNGREQMGVSYVQSHTRNGLRCSAEKAFLRPIRRRKNLKILTGARVTKILINPDTKAAYGVQFARNKKYHSALASKEVIVSAGGLNSPQLLMLSGIGPKDHLMELGIPLIQNLPVGRIMYDHGTFLGVMFSLNESIALDLDRIVTDLRTYTEYLKYGRGPFSSIGGVEAVTYVKTNVSDDPDPSYPDMELLFIGGGVNTDKGSMNRRMFNIPQATYDKIWKPFENKPLFQVLPMLIHPKSRGYLKLKSKNPFHWPKFYANYFSDPENTDIKTFIAAIRIIQEISLRPALQKYGATLVDIPIPGCEHHIFNSDAYWECGLRTLIGSLYHQVATCKMGPIGDLEAVVDPELKVYGIKNLRVADTSVIPLPLSAHTAAPSYMVGEKASDLIKQEWGVL